MYWLILAFISVFALSISNILQRVLLKDQKSNSISYALVFQFTCALLVFGFALTVGFILPPIAELWPNFILMTILYAGFIVFLFKALQTVEVSEVMILAGIAVLWTIGISLVFLGESFNLNKIIGTVLILAAVVWVLYKGKRITLNKGSLYALLAWSCSGIAFANDTYILRQSDAISYTAIAFGFPAIATLLIRPNSITKMKQFLKPAISLKMALAGIFYSLFSITIYMAYQQGGNASQLAPILQSRVIITILLASIFLGERDELVKKILAAILVSAGVLLIK